MIRGSASPAAAGGRRGGRAAGLLPASLVTAAAAAALFPSFLRARGESSAERTRDQNVCFPVWGKTALVKWYVDLGGKPVVSHSSRHWRDRAEGCVRKLPWTCYRVVTTRSVLEPCFHNLWLAC